MTPNTGSFDQAVAAEAMGEVLKEAAERSGQKAVFITHSQGGAVGWDVAVENIAAIVAIEPGGAPQPGTEQYTRLLEAKIPVILYFGPSSITQTAVTRQSSTCRRSASPATVTSCSRS